MTIVAHVQDPDTLAVARLFEKAGRTGETVRVMVDEEGVKFSRGGQVWSPGVGFVIVTPGPDHTDASGATTGTPCPAWCSGTHG
jgi:hypothetical protein